MSEFNLSEKIFETDVSSGADISYVPAFHEKDVKEFIRLLKEIKHANGFILDEEIDKLAGEKLC